VQPDSTDELAQPWLISLVVNATDMQENLCLSWGNRMHAVSYCGIADSWKSHMTLCPMLTFLCTRALKPSYFESI